MSQELKRYKYLADELVELAKKGQPEVLEKMLAEGIPLVFTDEQGRLMQKNQDGSITSVEAENADDAQSTNIPS